MADKQSSYVLKNNPVDSSFKLGIDHLPYVRAAMVNVRSFWYDIGVEFEVDTDTLDDIKARHKNVSDACLTETIAMWLKNGKHPNLRAVIVAIASASAGRNPREAEKKAKEFKDGMGCVCSAPESIDVDSSELERNASNQKELVAALTPIGHKWMEIGTVLGLPYDLLQVIKTGDSQPVQDLVKKWLKGRYNIEMFGPPSWKKLVEAVGSKAGGNDNALALSIAKDHRAPIVGNAESAVEVTSNPQDIDETRLTTKHYADLFEALSGLASKWRSIGTFLGFLPGELDNIESRPGLYTIAPESWLGAMLVSWLEWAPRDGRGSENYATLGGLKLALNKAGLGVTATELQDKLKL